MPAPLHHPDRLAPARRVVWALLVAAGASALVTVMSASRPHLRPTAQLATASLTNDGGSAALFSEAQLVPGRTSTACISVSYSGSAPGDVRLAATVSGPLAGHLDVTVEQGTGGAYGDCTGFRGQVFFSGTLAQLGTSSGAAAGLATGWSPSTSGSRTFRLTTSVVDSNAAQSQQTSADFVWTWVGATVAPPPAPSPTPSLTPSPTPTPASPVPAVPAANPTPTGAPAPNPTATSTPSTGTLGSPGRPPSPGPGHPSPATAPTKARTAPARPGTSPTQAHHAAVGAPEHRTSRTGISYADLAHRPWWRRLQVTTERVVERSGFPVVLAVLVFVFLAVQNNLDRRDPKLRFAPLRPEPDLPFDTHATARPDGSLLKRAIENLRWQASQLRKRR